MVLVSVDEIEVDVYFLTAQSGEEAVIETDIFVSEGTKELFLQVISPFWQFIIQIMWLMLYLLYRYVPEVCFKFGVT